MLDGVSLDQLRTFIAAVEEGSFSGAARKLRRAQSMVSELVSNLEGQIGVTLFDRSGRYPTLTTEGRVLLADARHVVSGVDWMKARAKGMASGLEPELSVVLDVFFPLQAVVEVAKAFRERFPQVPLRIYADALGGAFEPVIDGRAALGIVGSLPYVPAGLASERLTAIGYVMVAASSHPLAAIRGPIGKDELARHMQLVLTDRSALSAGREFGVMSGSVWRFVDLFAKHAFLLQGLGWGGMPLHIVADDIAAGRLVELQIEDVPPGGLILPMLAVYPSAAPPGPAGRWLVEQLRVS
ncbi:LysR family transcriptional regulator [Paraburkholderia pallida]|uniref:LysR family transcriptional regulator n=1 Tax=Paraburkholderia pallida TaxID=2547399 RepID=A0A4P7D9X0_9BURK|nr:LysR family transcriptional regulator [Paraburkholderia pallida]QBR03502.1 LysR family transcriptional regulator [Paraburkholderia pallida]